MKKIYTFSLLIFALCYSTNLIGQKTIFKGAQKSIQIPVGEVYSPERPASNVNIAEGLPLSKSRTDLEAYLGNSLYDLQTNHSIMNRLVNYGDGKVSAVWTRGVGNPAFADRGTGYNHFDGNSWGPEPTIRIESLRTGWPSIVTTDAETELIIAHDFATHEIITNRKAAGETTWTQSAIPSIPTGIVWPQMAKGEGEYVHVIAISTTIGAGGGLYNGVDGQILYYRSPDAGLTWDITDFVIPGLDSTSYELIRRADAYKVAARGNTVAVAVFSWWEDVRVFKSEDNGLTWTQHIVYDFPFEKYNYDDGYTYDQLPADPNAPDSLAIFTGGNAGNVVVDNDGKLHLFFGAMYVIDDVLTDDNFNFFPCSSGIYYWNESHGPDSTRLIANIVDANQNDTLDIDCFNFNFDPMVNSLTTSPNAGIDANNGIYLTYSALTENYLAEGAMPNPQLFRHVYAIKSLDGGATWTEPYDIVENYTEPVLIPFYETVYPTVAIDVDEQMHIMFMRDLEPGTNFTDDDDFTANEMIYLAIDVEEIGVGPVNVNQPRLSEMKVSPNPTADNCYISLESESYQKAEILVYDLMGKIVYREFRNFTDGTNRFSISLIQQAKGIYSISVIAEDAHYNAKVLVQ